VLVFFQRAVVVLPRIRKKKNDGRSVVEGAVLVWSLTARRGSSTKR
jgi:hypothetical protein